MKALTTCAFFAALAVFSCWSCDPTPGPCPAIYKPVCATFTRTFASTCVLKNALCPLAKEGFQYTEEIQERDCCKRVCTREYNPTCGTNMNIYNNKCELQLARCRENDWFVPTDMMYCQQQSSSTTSP